MKSQRPIFRRTKRLESWTPGELFSEYWEESRGGWLVMLLVLGLIWLAEFFATW